MDLALNNLQRLICHKTLINKQIKRFQTTEKPWNISAHLLYGLQNNCFLVPL